MKKVVVSACLLGCDCRYKGDNCKNAELLSLLSDCAILPVCPEQMGGLSTPRPPAERQGDRVVAATGTDVTGPYRRGAQTALYLAQLTGADFAVLKAKSPSCGKGLIYDGSFTGNKIPGNGITVELFAAAGIPVYTEEETEAIRLALTE